MANTINDLYLKYVNKVGKTLENDRYFQYLFEMVQAGQTTLQQTHQVLHKVVDERWLTVIEQSLDAIARITDNPRRFVTTSEEVVPVALAKKNHRRPRAPSEYEHPVHRQQPQRGYSAHPGFECHHRGDL